MIGQGVELVEQNLYFSQAKSWVIYPGYAA